MRSLKEIWVERRVSRDRRAVPRAGFAPFVGQASALLHPGGFRLARQKRISAIRADSIPSSFFPISCRGSAFVLGDPARVLGEDRFRGRRPCTTPAGAPAP